MNHFKDVIPILDVRNISRALDYYVEKLGFQVEFRYTEDPDNYAGIYRDSVYLHMQCQHEDEFVTGTAGRLRVRIIVDDPDTLYHEYKAKGIFTSDVQIRDTAWGTREFGFRDLDGNALIFYRDLTNS